MIDARGKWISSTLAGVMSQLVLYELWHHGRRCAADLAFLGDLFPAFSRPLLDGLVGSLEAGGFVRTSKNPVDCRIIYRPPPGSAGRESSRLAGAGRQSPALRGRLAYPAGPPGR